MSAADPSIPVPHRDPEIPAEQFRSVFRRHPAGVAVVALSHGGQPFGFTATSLISVSLEPPLLAFSVTSRSAAGIALASTGSVTINFLVHDQAWVADRFATRRTDRFGPGFVDGIDWFRLPTGEPVIAGVGSWLRGHVRQQVPAGSSRLVVVEAVHAHRATDDPPLLYHDRSYHQLNHLRPSAAPPAGSGDRLPRTHHNRSVR